MRTRFDQAGADVSSSTPDDACQELLAFGNPREPGWGWRQAAEKDLPSVMMGTVWEMPDWTARRMSSAKPNCISSCPLTLRRTAAETLRTEAKAARVTADSTDNGAPSMDRPSRTVAAPRRSSTHGRRVPSGQSSPAAMTPTGLVVVP